MSSTRRKKGKNNNKSKQNLNNNINSKKILDGVEVVNKDEVKDFDQVIKDIRSDIVNTEFQSEKTNNNDKNKDINDKIQSFISILFTIVIFALILILIFVLYDKFLKKKDDIINIEEVCRDYIKKDYDINIDDVRGYIIDNRFIIYNINEFDITNINTKTINDFSRFIIWNSDSEYTMCDNNEYCLDTKKEIDYDTLKVELMKYFNLNNFNLVFDYDFNDDDATRLYLDSNKVILTFKNMEYETLKHDIVDIRVDDDNIYIIFALSKRIDEDNFGYVGFKKLNLLYQNDKFIIKSIETNIK